MLWQVFTVFGIKIRKSVYYFKDKEYYTSIESNPHLALQLIFSNFDYAISLIFKTLT